MNTRVLAPTTSNMNWKLLWRELLEHCPQPLLHSPASQLVAQVHFPCAAAQHDAAPPKHNSEAQAHAHSHSEQSDSPRPQAQCPASYYSCSEGGVIKHEAREFCKDLFKSGFVTQPPFAC